MLLAVAANRSVTGAAKTSPVRLGDVGYDTCVRCGRKREADDQCRGDEEYEECKKNGFPGRRRLPAS